MDDDRRHFVLLVRRRAAADHAAPFGRDVLHVGEAASTRLFTWLALGIGTGSLIAGRLSGEKVELGLVPIGSFGMGVFSLLLVWSAPSYAFTSASLLLLGFSAGFFAVPLNALIQQRPTTDEKGRVLAVTSFLNTIGILLASVVVACSARAPDGPEPDHRGRGRLHADRQCLRAGACSRLLRAIRAVVPDTHDLPDQDSWPAEHSSQRARR